MVASLHSFKHDIFRNLLIEARKDAQLTQVQLAEKLNIAQSFVSKYERGERRLDFTEFIEIADLLGIDPNLFIENYKVKVAATNPSN
jgi:transcriptional regulator with XRE-family HTH domain